jgi:hypothetical protein
MPGAHGAKTGKTLRKMRIRDIESRVSPAITRFSCLPQSPGRGRPPSPGAQELPTNWARPILAMERVTKLGRRILPIGGSWFPTVAFDRAAAHSLTDVVK